MIWLLLVGALIALSFWYKCVKPMSYWKNIGVKQTKPWPVVGDLWLTLFRRLGFCEFVEWLYTMHPNERYSGFYQLYMPTLLLKDPELIKQITVKDFDHFVDHLAFIDAESDPLWAGNLFALQVMNSIFFLPSHILKHYHINCYAGQKWREMRATLSGSFTSSKMKSMFHLMEEAAENFVTFFLDKNEDCIEVEMKDIYTRYTNDVIASAAFGIKCDSLAEPNNQFYLMGKEITNISSFKNFFKFIAYSVVPKLTRVFKIKVFGKEVTSFFTNLINDTIKYREEKGIIRPDMIHLLLEARKGIKQEEKEAIETGFATVDESAEIGKFRQLKNLTNDDITSQALIFFFAGFDTISTGLCFGSYELAVNKDIQDKLRKEIKETYETNDGKITYDVLLKMKYLDMVVSEILRKWPPVPSVDRVCTKPYTIEPVNPNEKPVPLRKGDIVWIPIHGIHRNPEFYPNPDKFDPERFSDENKNNIRHYTYLPFGTGPRNCIGSRFALLEIKSLLFNLLLHFEIIPGKKTTIPLKIHRDSFQHTAQGGFWLDLKRIKN